MVWKSRNFTGICERDLGFAVLQFHVRKRGEYLCTLGLVGRRAQKIRLRFLVLVVVIIKLTQIEIGSRQTRINLCGATERLPSPLAVLQLDFHYSKTVKCLYG